MHGRPQGASSLRGPLTQLLQPQTLSPGLREAHQTREQRELLLHGAPRTQTPEAGPPPVPPLPQWGGRGRRRGGRRAGLTQGPGRGVSTAGRGRGRGGSSEEEGGRRWALGSWAEPGRLRLQAGGWPLPSAPGPHPGAVTVGEGNQSGLLGSPACFGQGGRPYGQRLALTGRACSSRNTTPRAGAGPEPQPDTRPPLADRGPAPPDFLSRWQPPRKGLCSVFAPAPATTSGSPARGGSPRSARGRPRLQESPPSSPTRNRPARQWAAVSWTFPADDQRRQSLGAGGRARSSALAPTAVRPGASHPASPSLRSRLSHGG